MGNFPSSEPLPPLAAWAALYKSFFSTLESGFQDLFFRGLFCSFLKWSRIVYISNPPCLYSVTETTSLLSIHSGDRVESCIHHDLSMLALIHQRQTPYFPKLNSVPIVLFYKYNVPGLWNATVIQKLEDKQPSLVQPVLCLALHGSVS